MLFKLGTRVVQSSRLLCGLPLVNVPLHVHTVASSHLCATSTGTTTQRPYSAHSQPPLLPPPDLSEYLHGRRGNERKDSVTDYILLERQAHQARLDELPSPSKRILQSFSNRGFGTKKRKLSSAAQSIVSESRGSYLLKPKLKPPHFPSL